ncbi:MAG: DUF1328 domain-containing protein [Nanoarchaeota archaeon]|nr:DUF1328 domain-containing protein [Nanoarchaeota archaeon]
MAFDLIYLAVVFLVIALISYVLGARGFAGFTVGIARVLVWIFVILFLLSLLARFVL